MASDILIKTVDLSRHYQVGEEEVIALDKVNLEIERNKICAILGTSGSGKITLLNMLAGIERHKHILNLYLLILFHKLFF
mgnify:CR=1 FL=1